MLNEIVSHFTVFCKNKVNHRYNAKEGINYARKDVLKLGFEDWIFKVFKDNLKI